ncbi:uncharacterized protein LOC132543554 [Ylistrum balloti]|uniref:uncharacterized protein LOC132543554 n=1 Tax=Ylistrum balloti TaxID=509963 RepID=UPI002905A173|nr:uncharacterized protein LOC132543554 [Ylistrum balloti]
MDTERTPEEFVRSIDPGLLPYKEELFCLSVTSKETLKYLRPSEVQTMNIPVVFKRMLIERICNMQTPDTKKKFKAESEGHEVVSTENIIDVASTSKFKRYPKRLFGVEDENSINDSKPANHAHDVFAEKYEDQKPFLEKEMEKLKDERDSLTILMLHKKNELKDMRMVPEPLQPMAIPGGVILKTVCDKCHRRGHKAHGNRGNQACPFDKCEGYINCGNLTKHKDYKQSIMEAEKEVSNLEKEIKSNEEKITNLQAFLQHNTTNFVKMLKPRLQFAFQNKYVGKDGHQALQKDLRFIKIATSGKIPANLSTMNSKDLEGLLNAGKKMVSAKFNLEQEDLSSGARERTALSISVSTSTGTATCTNINSIPTYSSYQVPTMSVLPTDGNSMYQVWPGMYPGGMYPYNYHQNHISYNSHASAGMWFGSPSPSVPTTCTVSTPPQVPVLQGQDIFPPLPLDPPQTPRPPSPE